MAANEAIVDGKIHLLRGVADGVPSDLGIGTERLAFDEGNLAMAELRQMLDGEARGAGMIEHDIGDAGQFAMPGNGDYRDGHAFLTRGVYRDEAFHGALLQQARIFFD